MASLRSLILDGKIADPFATNPTVEQLKSRDTILVNAQASFASVQQTMDRGECRISLDGFRQIPCPKPPYRTMWIESLQRWASNKGEPQRTGVFTIRTPAADSFGFHLDRLLQTHGPLEPGSIPPPEIKEQYLVDRPADIVVGTVWYERDGSAFAGGSFCYWLSPAGDLQFSFVAVRKGTSQAHEDALGFQELWCLQTMAQLNCHNVELAEIAGQAKPKPGRKPHPPFSVWHEIVVKPSNLVKRARAENPADAEKHAVRLHKVRGHYADYRKGAGLFGKYKVLIWVDEHEAGEADLGTVVSSYRVQ